MHCWWSPPPSTTHTLCQALSTTIKSHAYQMCSIVTCTVPLRRLATAKSYAHDESAYSTKPFPTAHAIVAIEYSVETSSNEYQTIDHNKYRKWFQLHNNHQTVTRTTMVSSDVNCITTIKLNSEAKSLVTFSITQLKICRMSINKREFLILIYSWQPFQWFSARMQYPHC